MSKILSLFYALTLLGCGLFMPTSAYSAELATKRQYIQCVPFARQLSNVRIYGDAHSWWGQAAGRYARGSQPQLNSVMALKPHGRMRLGHVAVVSEIIDSRTILLDHANWSPINGRRGQIERGVRAIDVSGNNDWSRVKIWYAPLGALGTTAYPVHGFIYADQKKPPRLGYKWAAIGWKSRPLAASAPKPSRLDANFAQLLYQAAQQEAAAAK